MFEKYERLPTKVDAVQFTEGNKNRVYNELTGQYAAAFEDGKPILKVVTTHGEEAIVRIGDWIAKDMKLGTYYPIKDEYFRANFA